MLDVYHALRRSANALDLAGEESGSAPEDRPGGYRKGPDLWPRPGRGRPLDLPMWITECGDPPASGDQRVDRASDPARSGRDPRKGLVDVKKTYTVLARRSGGWWAISVPELKGVHSQARRLDQ